MFRNELAIHYGCGKLKLELAAERHSLTSVARHIDEDSLDALHIDIDREWRRGLRQYEVNVVAGYALEHELEVA